MQKLILKDKEFIIRNFRNDDSERPDKFLAYINNLIEDSEAMISLKMKKTLEQEKEWVANTLSLVKLSRMVVLIAERNDLIVGQTAVSLCPERKEHIAELGISVIRDYRGYGLGPYLLSKILYMAEESLRPKPIMIRLSVFSSNERAISLYQKHGFEIIARIPKQLEFNGQFVDEIVMLYYI